MSRRGRSHDSHVSHERWLVSYADFVTLLFAFFVVLYASSQVDRRKIAQLAASIHGAFHQLGAFPGDLPAPVIAPPDQNKPEPPNLSPEMKELIQSVQQQMTAESPGLDVESLRRELQAVLGDEIKDGEIEMRVTPVGFVISLKELGFFESGEAKLLPGAINKLTRIATVLNRHGFDIRVEGHTDNKPIHTAEFRSNWELSTARAIEVVRLLVEQFQVDPTRVAVAGYGEFRPIAGNDTPEGRRKNRRVDLVVVSHTPAFGVKTNLKEP